MGVTVKSEEVSKSEKLASIESKGELEHILRQYGVDTTMWRTRLGVKTVTHLWKEVFDRECTLVFRKKCGKVRLVRMVNRVYLNIFCRHQGKLLYVRETKQVFADGGRRYRTALSRPSVGEKIKPDESLSEAFIRAMKEELSLSGGYVVASRKKVSVKEKKSKSYPGLASHLTTYSFYVELSPKQYRKQYLEKQLDKTTLFGWRVVSRQLRFVHQYQKARKAFQRRKQYVRKQSVGMKRKVCPLKRYIVY